MWTPTFPSCLEPTQDPHSSPAGEGPTATFRPSVLTQSSQVWVRAHMSKKMNSLGKNLAQMRA